MVYIFALCLLVCLWGKIVIFIFIFIFIFISISHISLAAVSFPRGVPVLISPRRLVPQPLVHAVQVNILRIVGPRADLTKVDLL